MMLEARQTCSGATGRNGEHCRADRYLPFNGDLKALGKDGALLLKRLEEDNVKKVGEFTRSMGLSVIYAMSGPPISLPLRQSKMVL
jgi:hypothetical protein